MTLHAASNEAKTTTAMPLIGSFTGTSEPAIYISMEYSSDYDDCNRTGSWRWVAKRSWTYGGAIRTEVLEVPQDAEGADEENVESMIRALTREPVGSAVKYAVSKADEEPRYVAVRIA